MALAPQSLSLIRTARKLTPQLPADAVLLLVESPLDWDLIQAELADVPLLVATEDNALIPKLKAAGLSVVRIEPGALTIAEKLSQALIESVRTDRLRQNADVVALYNGIETSPEEDRADPFDSLSVVHLGEHLERLSMQDLRNLDTQVPLETLRTVVNLAVEIGREGREGKPVGTMFVVGDTRKVLSMSRAMNFNPFRGYSHTERDIRNRQVREQIKDIAQLEGAILIRRDGVAVAACMRIEAPDKGYTLSMGLGTRHAAAAAISMSTKAVAVVVSQSSGTVRLFHNGAAVLHIEPFARPMIWGQVRMEADDDGQSTVPLSALMPD